ncbi:helix-turn-helix domain-containing protein [Streptomyces sp. CBMA29]|uniref:MmyB family transcriptional regulator n=1 Tax=Streptomyces sp. CBMA29 TaxID=1896314 RepID=UPI0016620648|nr:helix-turn-helix domain-containing protein [Streptomyces sp. CBMA29]MBD0740070.1 hypothetical protein [Streptomyces sp. CBMA29]
MTRGSNSTTPLIRGFLRQARKDYAGPPEPGSGHAGHRPAGLSQQAVAHRMDISPRLYQDWEGGGRPVPVHRLDSLASTLGLDPHQRDELWFIVTGGFAPTGPSQPDLEAMSGWRLYLRALQVPALVLDSTWRIHEDNAAWRGLFEPEGQRPPANLLRFILFSPYARRLCGDWQASWAVPYLRQLRLEAGISGEPELRRIVAELQLDPELGVLWQTVGRGGRMALHNDGQVRLLIPPGGRAPYRVRTLVSSPAHNPRVRMVTLLPTPVEASVIAHEPLVSLPPTAA